MGFVAKLSEIKLLATVLRLIAIRDLTTFSAVKNKGVQLSNGESGGSLRTKAYLPKSLFEEFQVEDDEEECVTLRMNMEIAFECLSIFCNEETTGTAKCRIKYAGAEDNCVEFLIEERQILTSLKFTLLDPAIEEEYCHEEAFGDYPTVGKMILDGKVFLESIMEFSTNNSIAKNTSTGDGMVKFNFEERGLLMLSCSNLGNEVEVFIDKQNDKVDYYYNSSTDSVCKEGCYRINTFNSKLLSQVATRVSIRMNQAGLLSLQFMIPNVTNTSSTTTAGTAYVEYLLEQFEQNNN